MVLVKYSRTGDLLVLRTTVEVSGYLASLIRTVLPVFRTVLRSLPSLRSVRGVAAVFVVYTFEGLVIYTLR